MVVAQFEVPSGIILERQLQTARKRQSGGRAMAQAVSHRPLTAEARVRSRVGPGWICGGQSGTRTGFSPTTSVFPCQFHSTGAPLRGKIKKINYLHHRVAQ